jgi:hypothetical protein
MAYNPLAQKSWWIVNRHIAIQVGIEASLLLSDLVTQSELMCADNKITEIDGMSYFDYSSKKIEENTTMSYALQKKHIKKLEELGYIRTRLMGLPAKLYFAVDENKILNFLNTCSKKIPKHYNNILYNKEPIIKKKEENFLDKKNFALFDEVCSYFDSKAYSGTNLNKWLECYDKLIRLDGYTEEKILAIVKEFRKPDNWWRKNGNFESLLKLRKTGKDGVTFAHRFSQALPTTKPDKLGEGEYIDNNGNRTYGDGRVVVPKDAPKRPTKQYGWNAEINKWTI